MEWKNAENENVELHNTVYSTVLYGERTNCHSGINLKLALCLGEYTHRYGILLFHKMNYDKREEKNARKVPACRINPAERCKFCL
jgi:hypothetical protein